MLPFIFFSLTLCKWSGVADTLPEERQGKFQQQSPPAVQMRSTAGIAPNGRSSYCKPWCHHVVPWKSMQVHLFDASTFVFLSFVAHEPEPLVLFPVFCRLPSSRVAPGLPSPFFCSLRSWRWWGVSCASSGCVLPPRVSWAGVAGCRLVGGCRLVLVRVSGGGLPSGVAWFFPFGPCLGRRSWGFPPGVVPLSVRVCWPSFAPGWRLWGCSWVVRFRSALRSRSRSCPRGGVLFCCCAPCWAVFAGRVVALRCVLPSLSSSPPLPFPLPLPFLLLSPSPLSRSVCVFSLLCLFRFLSVCLVPYWGLSISFLHATNFDLL